MPTEIVKDDTYEHHHEIVKQGLRDFVEVARSLFMIREHKLFKVAGYKTFIEYCRTEHDLGKSQAYRFAASYEEVVKYGVDKDAARALLECPKENRDMIVMQATARTGSVEAVNREIILDINDEVVERAVDKDVPKNETKGDLDTAGIRQLLTSLRMCLRDLDALVERPEGAHIPHARTKSDIINAGEAIKQSIPARTCPVCSGAGCKFCKNTGWLPANLYEVAKDHE